MELFNMFDINNEIIKNWFVIVRINNMVFAEFVPFHVLSPIISPDSRVRFYRIFVFPFFAEDTALLINNYCSDGNAVMVKQYVLKFLSSVAFWPTLLEG